MSQHGYGHTHHMGTLASRGACARALSQGTLATSDRIALQRLYYPYSLLFILAPGSSYTLYVASLYTAVESSK